MTGRSGPRPPRIPRFLRALLPADLLGDLEESFHARIERSDGSRRRALFRARWWYRREVARALLRLRSVRRSRGRPSPVRSADVLVRDVRIALRSVARRPGFSAVVIVTLALGIGANATVFSLVSSLFFRSTGVGEAERVIQIYGSRERDRTAAGMFRGFMPLSLPNIDEIDRRAATLEGVYAFTQWPVSLDLGDVPERGQAAYVSASYFDLLRLRPAAGRFFRSEEDDEAGAAPVAVISHSFWEERLGAVPEVVGREIRINARAYRIVGVAPDGFRGTSTTATTDLWLPVSMIVDVPVYGPFWRDRGVRMFFPGARLAEGRTLAEAEAELDRIALELSTAYPDINAERGLQALPLLEARVAPNLRDTLADAGTVLMGAVSLILLIACLNVSNLLLTRAVGRRRELAIRRSVGAGRGRLVSQLLTETVVLFGLGGLAGLLLSLWGQEALSGIRPPDFFGGALEVRTDLRVVGFTAAVTLACSLGFGLLPAWRASRADPAGELRDGDRGGSSSAGHRVRTGLVAAQIALSSVALVAAGLFVADLRAATEVELGFEPAGLGMLSVDLGAHRYGPEEGLLFQRAALEAAEAVPGVRSAAVGQLRPLTVGAIYQVVPDHESPDDPDAGRMARADAVSPGYFATLGTPLLRGRTFREGDRAEAEAVGVVNERLASLLWPDADAVGRMLRVSLTGEELTVVGVVADSRQGDLAADPQPTLYRPTAQAYPPTATLFVRADGSTAGVLETVRRAVQEVDPTLPLFDVEPATTLVDRALWNDRAIAAVLTAFGLLGLLLAAVGVYGVVSSSVKERTREMGLRMALGADRSRVLGLVLRRVLAVAFAGVAGGAVLAAAVSGLVGSRLDRVSALDPGTYLGTAALLLLVALVAGGVPAVRATRVDPVRALRAE